MQKCCFKKGDGYQKLFDSCCDYLRSELGFTNIPLLAYDKQPKVHIIDSLKCSKIKELLDTNSTIFVIDKTVIVKQEIQSTSKTDDEKKRYKYFWFVLVDSRMFYIILIFLLFGNII